MAGEGIEHKSSYAFGSLGGRRGSGELLINLYRRTASPLRNESPWQDFWWGAPATEEEEPSIISGLDDDGGRFWRKRKKKRTTRRFSITRTVRKQVEEAAIELAAEIDAPDIRPFLEAFYPQTRKLESERLEAKALADAGKEAAREAAEEADKQFRKLIAAIEGQMQTQALARRRTTNIIIAVMLTEEGE